FHQIDRFGPVSQPLVLCALCCLCAAGCGHEGASQAKAVSSAEPPPVAVTVVDLQRRNVERAIEIEGTLKAWEEVSISAKKGGRVMRVAHDMGDRVKPGEVLVELDPVDAALAVRQAEARYIGELAKLGITRKQAEEFVKRYGADETLLHNVDVEQLIKE